MATKLKEALRTLRKTYYIFLINVCSHSEMNSHLFLLPQSYIAKGSLLTQLMTLSHISLTAVLKSEYSDQSTFPPFKTFNLPPSVLTLLYLIQCKKSSCSYLNLPLQGYSKQCFSNYLWWRIIKIILSNHKSTFINYSYKKLLIIILVN